jgi:hypothetical protein
MMSELRIVLPIPAKELSPNARIHWAKKAPITKSHRTMAYYEACGVGGRDDRIKSYRLEFTFADRRRRDRDNFSGRCKAYLDGIADAFNQNDSEWDFNGVKFLEPDKNNPRVEIVLELEPIR